MTARLEVEQLQADLEITVVAPNGMEREIDEFDFGTESVTISAGLGGIYRVRVVPMRFSRSPVKLAVFFETIQPTAASDRERIYAEDIATQSKREARVSKENWDKALHSLQMSLNLWQQLGDTKVIARTYLKLGDLYFNKGIWNFARTEYREAKQLCDAIKYLRCSAEASNNVGLTALNVGDLDEAQSELAAASQAWENLRLPLLEAITNSNLGLLFWESGEWQLALDHYDMARKLFRKRNSLDYARALNNIGLVYMSMAEYEKSSNYFSQALKTVLPLSEALPVQARIRINFGRAHMLNGHLAAALKDQQLAVSLMRRIRDVNGQAEALNNLGQVQIRCSRFTEAGDSLDSAYSLYQSINDQSGLSSILHNQGILSEKKGDLRGAEQELLKALEIRLGKGLRDDAAETLYQLAIVEQKTGKHEKSREHIQEAISLAQTLRTNVGGELLRQSYFAGKQKYVSFLVDELLSDRSRDWDDSFVTGAFETYEHARARSLVELLGEERLVLRGADPGLLGQRRSVQRRLNFKSVQLAAMAETPTGSATEAERRREIETLLAENAEIESALQSQIPGYRDVVAPHIITADEVRGLLSENDLLLEYFLGEGRSFVWIINQKQIRVTELPPRRLIERKARLVVNLLPDIQARRSDPRKEAFFQRALNDLAAALRLPVNKRSGSPRTIIVPDGFLNRVPFAVLPAGFRERSARQAVLPLGLLSEVVQVPSATVFRLLKERQQKTNRQLSVAVFADPVFDDLDSRVKTVEAPGIRKARTTNGLRLPRLSFSQLEVETVERLLPPEKRRIFRGFDATKSAFFSNQAMNYPILLLSTHAFADDRQPELSSIIFSLVDERGRPVDGLVHVYELYQLRLNSMVVLSACETASGREVDGEGVVGLSRGFLQAGAWGVLASPVRIEAEGSAYLINAFLEKMLGVLSLSPSRALLEARRALARSARWNDPYYWGSFILVSGLS